MENSKAMKISEAIKWLERVRGIDFVAESSRSVTRVKLNDKAVDALDLAISALEFRQRYDQFWDEVKIAGENGKETEIHHSGMVFKIRKVAQ